MPTKSIKIKEKLKIVLETNFLIESNGKDIITYFNSSTNYRLSFWQLSPSLLDIWLLKINLNQH